MDENHKRAIWITIIGLIIVTWIIANDPEYLKAGIIYYALGILTLVIYFEGKKLFGK